MKACGKSLISFSILCCFSLIILLFVTSCKQTTTTTTTNTIENNNEKEQAPTPQIDKPNHVSLIINLNGGETTTALENGENGNKILKGVPGEKVEIKELRKENHTFERWESALPKVFPQKDDKTVYVAQWKEGIRVTLKGDERLKIEGEDYIDIPIGVTKTFGDIKAEVLTKTSLKPEWGACYAVYDFKINDEDGKKIVDSTQITSGITIYIRSNYTKFKWNIKNGIELLVGYDGDKPKGRIIIPAKTLHLKNTTFKDCNEITALDFSECNDIKTLNIPGVGITSIDLSKCTKLINLDLSKTGITSIDVSKCTDLTWLVASKTAIENIDLSQCTKLRVLDLSSTKITNINLYQCKDLVGLYLNNTNITSIDLSQCTKLTGLYLINDEFIRNLDVSQCTKLEKLWIAGLPITNIDLSRCKELIAVIFIYCENLQNVNLENCTKLKSLGYPDFYDNNIKYPAVSGCPNAIVKLPSNIQQVLEGAFGKDESTWCKRVIAPNETIKNLVKAQGYPESKIVVSP